MNGLNKLIRQIDAIDITGYPSNEQKVQEKSDLIMQGLEVIKVNSSFEPNDQIREFIKRIYWYGYELGSNKAFEMSKYITEQIDMLKKAIQLGKNAFGSHEKEILPYLKLFHSLEQDQFKKKQLEKEIALIEGQA